eukprot:EST41877.1 SNF7 family protein [Spironucleus salmonicida]
MKKNKDVVKEAIKQLDKEIMRLEFENTQLNFKIQQSLKANQLDVLKIHAKQQIRNQKAVEQFHVQKAHLSCLNLRMLQMQSMQVMTGAISATDKMMDTMLNNIDIQGMSKQMQGFMKNMDKMTDRQEMMDELLEDVFSTENEDQNMDKMVDEQVQRLIQEVQMKELQNINAGVGMKVVK